MFNARLDLSRAANGDGGGTLKGVAAAIALLVVSPATAQDVGQFSQHAGVDSQTVVAAQIGACVLRHDRADAMAFIAPHATQAKDLPVQFMNAMQRCIGHHLSVTLRGSSLRSAIAEAALNENGGTLLANARKLPSTPPLHVSVVERDASAEVLRCAVAAQPSTAADLIAAPAASPAETTAFRALGPALIACAPVAGEVHLSPGAVRGAIALALYRRVAAAQ